MNARPTCAPGSGLSTYPQAVRPAQGAQTAATVDGDAVQHRRARQRVERLVVGEHVAVHPGTLGGDPQSGAGLTVAPAVRQADDARADARRSPRPARRPARPRLVTRASPPSASPRRRGVVGMHLQRAARLALHQHLDVVHPRVVAAQVPATDEHQRPRRRGRARPRRRATSAISPGGASSIVPERVRRTSGRRGSSAPKSTPWGLPEQREAERRPASAPNASP